MKKFISIFLIISVLIVSINTTSVYASVSDNQGDRIEQNIVHFTNGVLDGYSRMLRYAGIIIDSSIEASRNTMQFVKDRLVALGLLQSGAADEDVEQFFDDNIVQNGKDVTYTSNLNVYIKSEINQIISSSGYKYGFSYDILKNTTKFASGDLYNATKNFIETNADYVCMFKNINSAGCWAYKFKKSEVGFVISNSSNLNKVGGAFYDLSTWQKRISPAYMYNAQTNTFDYLTDIDETYWFSLENDGQITVSDAVVCSYNETNIYKVYSSLADLKAESVGSSPYYITDSYNDYQTVSGSYNTSTDDHSVTYSDVVNFNNTYYGDNGNYPTAETIYQYINTNEGTDTPADNTPSGGGGGSGGDDNGEDNGGSIFDWLSRIGALIGDLISGVGGFIAGILEGIVSALTSIFETITSIITNITSVIPNSLNSLMTSILGWLPEEWSAVLSAFLLVSLLVGLFKLFRG